MVTIEKSLVGQLCMLKLNRIVIVVVYEGRKLMGLYCGELRWDFSRAVNSIYDKMNNVYSLALIGKRRHIPH